jgi:septal ring factor EnvC (AmiA/AmiB activator)
MAAINRLDAESAALGRQSAELKVQQAAARDASDQAHRAALARAELVRQMDARRDLNAKMVAELAAVHDRLTKTFAALPATSAEDPTLLPLRPFRGAIAWPAPGRVTSRFGQRRSPRFGTTTRQNGVEIATPDGVPVTAVHEGRVAFAGVFTGFGQLVIVDHGNLAYSLYGYLSSVGVIKGERVRAGRPIGTAGRAPGGNSALYFELRIDGKPVDPVQWLEAKR